MACLIHIQFQGSCHLGSRSQTRASLQGNPFRQIHQGDLSVRRLPVQSRQGFGKEKAVLATA